MWVVLQLLWCFRFVLFSLVSRCRALFASLPAAASRAFLGRQNAALLHHTLLRHGLGAAGRRGLAPLAEEVLGHVALTPTAAKQVLPMRPQRHGRCVTAA